MKRTQVHFSFVSDLLSDCNSLCFRLCCFGIDVGGKYLLASEITDNSCYGTYRIKLAIAPRKRSLNIYHNERDKLHCSAEHTPRLLIMLDGINAKHTDAIHTSQNSIRKKYAFILTKRSINTYPSVHASIRVGHRIISCL